MGLNLQERALLDVRVMWRRLERPANWMDNPSSWIWRRADGAPQGFGYAWTEDIGLANLLWLTLGMDTPPTEYDAGTNPLFMRVIAHARTSLVSGASLLDLAARLPLKEFAALLPATSTGGSNPLECAYPLLKLLARDRLRC